MRHFLFAILAMFAVTGCMRPQTTTDDFSDKSVVYGWVNLDDLPTRDVAAVYYNQLVAGEVASWGAMMAARLDGGFVYYGYHLPQGEIVLMSISGMGCKTTLCRGLIQDYRIASSDNPAASPIKVTVNKRGVFVMNSFAMANPQGALIGPGGFDIVPARGPSEKRLLEAILAFAPEEQKPLILARLSRL